MSRRIALLALITAMVAAVPLPVAAQTLPPGGNFFDDDANLHEGNIEAIFAAGITVGCGPSLFCPSAPVTRAEMAVFIIRALDETPIAHRGTFSDVPAGQWYTGHVERLAQLGITTGYPDGTYRPTNPVSRGEMAVFLMRALGEQPPAFQGTFSDVPAGLFFTGAVERIAQLGITLGCGGGRFCPHDQVLRDQMASFVARALGLDPIVPPPRAVRLAAVEVASGFEQPVFLVSPPGDSRLFVVDQPGRIWIVAGGATLATPFLDIRDLVRFSGEQGLLGLAFHPQYASNGRFFVNYIDNAGDTRIIEYRASSSPDVADAGSARELLFINQPASNHNGGWMAFGPDGVLYIAQGDGGGGNDQFGNGQNPNSLLGSILRMDVNQPTPGAEIWVKGVRNPWRNAFDGNNLYVADVGQGAIEEISVITTASAGANLGWPILEGTRCLNAPTCNSAGFVAPVHEYTHSDGCSITGGYVYRGAAIPEITGRYFFSDYCSGWVRSFRYEGGTAVDVHEYTELGSLGSVTSFGVDSAGEIYVTVAEGQLLKLVRG
ncbi:MAG TPA: PQQ-dependent sugar dehydrogenase [Acidimicrobiia bacterium]